MRHTMIVVDVARALGVTRQCVHLLDHELKPIRVGRIRMRLYDPDVVERFRVKRNREKSS